METLSLNILPLSTATNRYKSLHVAVCRGALQALQNATPPKGGDVAIVASPCSIASRKRSGGSYEW
jgi:hypothetical protein